MARKKYSLNNVRMSGPCSSFFIQVYTVSQISFPKTVLCLCYYFILNFPRDSSHLSHVSKALGKLLRFLTTCLPELLSNTTLSISTVTFSSLARVVYLIFFKGSMWTYILFYCLDHYPEVKWPSPFLSCVISLILHGEMYTYNLHRILPDHSISHKSFSHLFLIPHFLCSAFLLLLRLLVFSIIG